MSHYNWEWEYGPYEFRDPLNPELPVYEPTPRDYMPKPHRPMFLEGNQILLDDYETAVNLAINVFEHSHMVKLKIAMENREDSNVTLDVLRQTELFPVVTQYLEKHPDKSFNDVLSAIEILLEEME